ncbi:hypothetical protein BC831DRAFT_479532 [Entophlyctis helioformis]|nr:hypothetical protein BC831DRAFT_479532 [Entophlyctis helioformis]
MPQQGQQPYPPMPQQGQHQGQQPMQQGQQPYQPQQMMPPPTMGHGQQPAGGMGLPPPTRLPYSAYPEYNVAANSHSYQGAVSGLSGWNDPPKLKAPGGIDVDKILSSVESPEGVIVAAFTEAIDSVKGIVAHQPAQRQKVEDTERRIDGLFDRLASHKIDRVVLAQLLEVAQDLNNRDFANGQARVLKMMTSNYSNETAWLLGAKRLIELLRM